MTKPFSSTVAIAGATGSVSVDVSLTNFFDSQNLITAAGLTRDPSFSLILPSGVNGAFISTNTNDGSTTLATSGVNDVLAQLFFSASADASGQFAIQLGAGSALSDGQGFAVDFDFTPGTITVQNGPVVPLPTPVALGAVGLLGVATRRRRASRLDWRSYSGFNRLTESSSVRETPKPDPCVP